MKGFLAKFVLNYLRILTKLYIKRNDLEIIGITGSVGKTTLSLAVHQILSQKYKTGITFKHGHGLNSQTGIPFAILGVGIKGYSVFDWLRYLLLSTKNFFFKKCNYEKYVVEMGVDMPGDMEFLLKMIEPKVGVFLSIAKGHTANFETLAEEKADKSAFDLVFEEKARLIKHLSASSWAVLNFDQKKISALKSETQAKVITFGRAAEADIKGKIIDVSEEGFEGVATYENQKLTCPPCTHAWGRREVKSQKLFINKKMFTTLLAAIAVGLVYDISFKNCVSALGDFNLPPGRMTKIPGIKDTVIIDSSYNASKLPMLEALNNLDLFKNRKKIAVLGDMRELGEDSKSEHEEVAKKAAEVADEMVLIGPQIKKFFVPKAIALGFDQDKIHHFNNTWKALDFIRDNLIEGREAILVKGSQNTLFLEIVVEGLMKDKSKASELLCRRGRFWEKKRESLRK